MADKIQLYGFFKNSKNGKVFQTQFDWVEKENVQAGSVVEAFDEEDVDQKIGEFVVSAVGSPFQIGFKGKQQVYLYTGEDSLKPKQVEDRHVDGCGESAIFAR